MKLTLIPIPTRRCQCGMCKRGRKYYRLTSKMNLKDREWMRGFYDYVMEMECELDMRDHCAKN